MQNRFTRVLVTALVMGSAACVGPLGDDGDEAEASATTEEALSVPFRLRNRATGRCLTFDGARVSGTPCNAGNGGQVLARQPLGGDMYQLVFSATGRCLLRQGTNGITAGDCAAAQARWQYWWPIGGYHVYGRNLYLSEKYSGEVVVRDINSAPWKHATWDSVTGTSSPTSRGASR